MYTGAYRPHQMTFLIGLIDITNMYISHHMQQINITAIYVTDT